MTNWGTRPIVLDKGELVAHLEEASVIATEDEVWKEEIYTRVATIDAAESIDRGKQLSSQLHVGNVGTLEEQKAFKDVLCSMNDVFALTEHELGETNLVEHRIDLEQGTLPVRTTPRRLPYALRTEYRIDLEQGTLPVRTTPRRLPYALRTELEKELSKLLESGCIEPSTSPYSSGLVLVRKKDGGLRVCVDYRGINKDTIPDCYPIPRLDDLIDMVGRCKGKIFSTLDLMKGYHQIRMEEDSKSKTAFVCHTGLFQYRRMPFGLTNAPATFQWLMNQLFSGDEWRFVFVYLDDLLMFPSPYKSTRNIVRKC